MQWKFCSICYTILESSEMKGDIDTEWVRGKLNMLHIPLNRETFSC